MFLLAANIQGYCFKMIGMTTMLSHLLVWESKQWERHTIIKRITEYLLLRHLSLSERNIVHIVDQLDFSLVNGVGGKTSWWLPADSFWTFFLVCANLSKKKNSFLSVLWLSSLQTVQWLRKGCDNFSDSISFSGSLLEAFEVLSKRLHLLKDIPLKVSSVQPLDSGFFSHLK